MEKVISYNSSGVDLDASDLTTLPEELFKATHIKELTARDNKLTAIPPAIKNLYELEQLWLHENQIEAIPAEIEHLTRLRDLWLMNNQISSVPPQIGALDNLQDLRLSDNKLNVLPPEIGQLTNLTHLHISYNNISSLPSTMSSLVNLKKLVADHNKFPEFPTQALPRNLESLDLRHNEIGGEAPTPMFILKNGKKLRKLKLQHNSIHILAGEIGTLLALEYLGMRGNQLLTLPPALGLCTSLKTLKLDDNKIDYLPPEVCFMTKLDVLSIANNSFLNIPQSIVKKGHKAVTKYFQEFHQETRPCTKIKLMVVGQENVGKSTIIQALQNTTKLLSSHKTPLSTDGIDIAQWKVKVNKTHKIIFSIWDFAGQEIYYNTHQFFMSNRAIYFLVWNLVSPEYSRLDFWLASIDAAGGGVVVLVGTHVDDPSCTEEFLEKQDQLLNEKYMDKYPFIRFRIYVDAKKGAGIEELKEQMIELAQTHPQFGKAMPSTHIKLEEAVEKEAKNRDPPIMSYEEYKQLAISCSINDENVLLEATKFLHNLGSLMYFPSRHSGLTDLVILRPQFLPSLMATLVSTKSTFIKNGILKHADLRFVWKKYATKLHPQFILLLEKFGILCRLQEESTSEKQSVSTGNTLKHRGSMSPSSSVERDRSPSLSLSPSYSAKSLKRSSFSVGSLNVHLDAEKSLIPLMLEDKLDIFAMASQPQAGAIGREFHFKFLMPGLFARLIVSVLSFTRRNNKSKSKLKEKSKHHNPQQAIPWKVSYGRDQLHISRAGTFGLASVDAQKSMISVTVWGRQASRLLALLCQAVSLLMEDCYANMKVDIYVPCSHCLEGGAAAPTTWSLKELEDRLLKEGETAASKCAQVFKKPDVDGNAEKEINSEVLLKDMIPDLALNDIKKVAYEDVKIEKEIGQGAFGVIYKGEYNGKIVAVKKLLATNDMGDGEDGVNPFKEFVHETAFMGHIDCNEIVKLLGVSLNPISMIQELMDKGDLQKFLIQNSPTNGETKPLLSVRTAVKLALDIARGCHYLHSQTPACIHADLKSPNVLLCTGEDGGVVAKLGDLGLSKMVFAPLNKRLVDNPRWLAPEIIANQEYNEMADVYSFGVILWEIVQTMLEGYQHPFDEFNIRFDFQLEEQILLGLRPTIPTTCPWELGLIINDCWSANYFERPTFDYVVEALDNYYENTKPSEI